MDSEAYQRPGSAVSAMTTTSKGSGNSTSPSEQAVSLSINHTPMAIKFYKQAPIFKSIIPLGYLALQIFCTLVIAITSKSLFAFQEHLFLDITFWGFTVMTLVTYVMCSFRNPGYIIGSQFSNPTPSFPNFEPVKKESVLSLETLNFASQAKKGHQRKTSVLSKGMQLNRHERSKSKGSVPTSEPALTTIERLDTSPKNDLGVDNFGDASNNYFSQQQSLSSTAGNPIGGGKHKRIPSYMKSIHATTSLSKSPNNNAEARKSAYETIQSKIASSSNTVATMNTDPDEIESQNNKYHLQPSDIDRPSIGLGTSQDLIFKDLSPNFKATLATDVETQKYSVNASTQEKTHLDSETNQYQGTSPRLMDLQVNSGDYQQRLLLQRDKVRSDQIGLNIIESVIEEQSFEIEELEVNQPKKNDPKAKFYSTNMSHKRLNEDNNCMTEEEEDAKTSHAINEASQKSSGDDDDDDAIILFVEYKYCTICNIEQPLRCKHCRKCDHCVATYDHHCPWIGNCVGERNRRSFFWFLFFQTIQILVGLRASIIAFWIDISTISKILLVAVQLALIGFFFMVASLLFFHGYLASKNLTTWEFLSWMKISYMKVWPRKYGSPFSKGALQNLRLFFRYPFSKRIYIHGWTMPTKLPKLRM